MIHTTRAFVCVRARTPEYCAYILLRTLSNVLRPHLQRSALIIIVVSHPIGDQMPISLFIILFFLAGIVTLLCENRGFRIADKLNISYRCLFSNKSS